MDPTEAVNPETGEANPYLPWVAADPVPFYDKLREQCPVATMEGMAGLGAHIISRYEDVRWALRNPQIFSSDLVAVDIGQERPLIPLQIDPPDHARYRRVIDPTLGPREVAALEPEIRRVVHEVIDRFIGRGTVDAHAEFTVPLPCQVFLQITDLPLDDLPTFLHWKDEIIRPGGTNTQSTSPVQIGAAADCSSPRKRCGAATPPVVPCTTTSSRSWPIVAPTWATT